MSSLFEFQIFLKIIKLVNKSKTSSLVYFGVYLFDKKNILCKRKTLESFRLIFVHKFFVLIVLQF